MDPRHQTPDDKFLARPRLQRILLTGAGGLCLALAVIAAILPVIPVTPFLLIAAGCFYRSSPRLHDWLLNHRLLGLPLRRIKQTGGFSRTAKGSMIATTAVLTGLYAWLAPGPPAARLTIAAFGVLIAVMIVWLPTAPRA